MDLGEGLAGVAVRVGDQTVVTNAGGGYWLEVGAGTYAVAAFGGAFAGESAVDRRRMASDISLSISGVVRLSPEKNAILPCLAPQFRPFVFTQFPGRQMKSFG